MNEIEVATNLLFACDFEKIIKDRFLIYSFVDGLSAIKGM